MGDKAASRSKDRSGAKGADLDVGDVIAAAAAEFERRSLVHTLVGGKTSAAELAQVIYDHPRYEQDLFAYVNELGGNTLTNDVYDALDRIEQRAQRPADHVGGIAGLGQLAGQSAKVAEADKTAGGDLLPYDGRGGWDAAAINRNLSQYDALAGTDNDGSRCAFATVLAAKVFQGPGAFPSWITAFKAQNGGQGSFLLEGQKVPAKVMDSICDAIVAGTATFRDLAWLQEALYDYAVTAHNSTFHTKDGVDTTAEVVSAATDKLTARSGDACTSPKEVLAAAKGLAEGSNLMVEWSFTRTGGQAGRHEMMISNHEGKLHLYDASGMVDGANLHPLTAKNLAPYFASATFTHSEMKLAATLTAKPGVARG